LPVETVDSMAAEYTHAMADASTEEWLPNKPIW
jgi:hypothetical protein